MRPQKFYSTVRHASGEENHAVIKRATGAVFHALRDRLTMEESDQVVAQLPHELKAVWQEGERVGRRPLKMDREAFYERVRQEAGLASTTHACWATIGVFAALKEQLSPGEADDVLAQLPKDLKEVWWDAQVPV